MRRARFPHLALPALAAALALADPAAPGPGAVASPDALSSLEGLDGRALLREAFDVRHAERLSCRVRLVLHDGRGHQRVRELESVTSHESGQMRSLGRVLAPASLRGMTILTLEELDRADDVFVYLPQFGRARRIAMSRRGDSFLGSDLSYDDFERQRPEDYAVLAAHPASVAGEEAIRLVTRPLRGGYPRVDFLVARADRAILEVRHHEEADAGASRVVSAPREGIVAHGRLRIPTRLRAERLGRGTHTVLEVSELDFDPAVDDRLFSIVTLEAGRNLLSGSSRERERARAD